MPFDVCDAWQIGTPVGVLSNLVRALLSGLAGTSAMTATMRGERRVQSGTDPVDYDATDHVVTAAATLLPRPPRTDSERHAIFVGVHWGYGSAVAVAYVWLRGRVPRPAAIVAFYALCQGMAFTLFPVLGGTPPPWRWRRTVLASSLAQHAVYVAAVAAADDVMTRAVPPRS